MNPVIRKTNIEYEVKYYPNVKIFRELYPYALVEGDKLANYKVSSESRFNAILDEWVKLKLGEIKKSLDLFGATKI